jgi:hypothetical protein
MACGRKKMYETMTVVCLVAQVLLEFLDLNGSQSVETEGQHLVTAQCIFARHYSQTSLPRLSD